MMRNYVVVVREGEMSDCPSYLGVTINDRLQSEQLIKYDLLVFCPPLFNVTFWLPNWGQRSAKTFDVHLRDSQRTHAVFLTRLLLDPATHRQSTLTTTKSPTDVIVDDRDLSTLFAAAAGVALTVLLLLVTLFVRLRSPCLSGTPSSSDSARQRRGRPCRVCVYVTVRVVYSVVVSFAAVLLTLGVFVQPEVDLITSVEDRLSAVSRGPWIVDVDRAAGDEALRQTRDAAARHSACTQYVNQLYTVVVDRVARVRSNRSQCVVGGSDRDAVRHLDGAVRRYAAGTLAHVDEYSRHVSATVSTLTSARTRHLAQLYTNDWTQLSVRAFNASQHHVSAERRLRALPRQVAATLNRPEVEFASFFGVDVASETRTWLDQFWNR